MFCSAMSTVSATEIRKRGNAVLLSEDDWRAIQESLHLVSIPGMRESILAGMATDVSELSNEPGWCAARGLFTPHQHPVRLVYQVLAE